MSTNLSREEYRVDWYDLADELGYETVALMLVDLYTNKLMTMKGIGIKLNVSAGAVGLKMKELGIQPRKPTNIRATGPRGPRLPR